MKLIFSNDWLRQKIDEEPDGLEVEARSPITDCEDGCEECDTCIYLSMEEQAAMTGVPMQRWPRMEEHLKKYK